jgi:hypothetical protein
VPERLELARSAGAETIDFKKEDVYDRIQEVTQGRGADACIDAVGTEPDTTASVNSVVDRVKVAAFMGTDRPHVLRQAIPAAPARPSKPLRPCIVPERFAKEARWIHALKEGSRNPATVPSSRRGISLSFGAVLASSGKSDITGAQNLHRPLAGSTARPRNLPSHRSGESPSAEAARGNCFPNADQANAFRGRSGGELLSTAPGTSKQRTKRLVTPRIVTDHIMMQEDYERLHEFLVETDNLLEISNDLRKVIEEEWPELVYKLPPKA